MDISFPQKVARVAILIRNSLPRKGDQVSILKGRCIVKSHQILVGIDSINRIHSYSRYTQNSVLKIVNALEHRELALLNIDWRPAEVEVSSNRERFTAYSVIIWLIIPS